MADEISLVSAWWITFRKASNAQLWYPFCFWTEQAFAQTVKLSVIWDAIKRIWRYCNDFIIPAGLPPDSLAVDHQRLYWTKRGEGVLISVDKATGGSLVRETLADIEEILAYGAHLQPLPGTIRCHYNTVWYDVISHTALQCHKQIINQSLTHCGLGDFNEILDEYFSSQLQWLMAEISSENLPSEECH